MRSISAALRFRQLDPVGVAGLLGAVLVGVDDLLDVILAQLVLAFAFHEPNSAGGLSETDNAQRWAKPERAGGRGSQLLGGIDEEHVVGLLALLQDEDADGDAGGVEEVRGQADHGVDMAVLEQLGADAFLGTATEEHAMRQDDRHHSFVFEVVKAVQQEGEVGGGLGGEAWFLKRTNV